MTRARNCGRKDYGREDGKISWKESYAHKHKKVWDGDHHKSHFWDKCAPKKEWTPCASHKTVCPDYDFGKLALAQMLKSGVFSFNGCGFSFNVGQEGAPIIGTALNDQWDPNATPKDTALKGADLGEVIMGLDGDDDIYGNGGNDLLIGGDGDDLLSGGEGLDIMVGGAGWNFMSGSGGGEDIFIGGEDTDQMRGNDDVNIFCGNGGHDEIKAGGGNDIVSGGDDYDDLYGGAGNDKMFGDNGDDRMWGDEGDDYLEGGAGDDALEGGEGNDFLRGGDGADEFRFIIYKVDGETFPDDLGHDVICDFDCDDGDTIAVSYELAGGWKFESLDIDQQGRDAVINLTNGDTITLANVDAATLTEDCFTFC